MCAFEKLNKNNYLAFCVAAVLGVVCVGAQAQPAATGATQHYPYKPLRIVVGFVPGGAVDFIARLMAQKLNEQFGQPVVVENRPGAATAIAAERVATAAADGYTLLLIPISTAVQSAFRKSLPYDLKRDLAPVTQLATGPLVLLSNPGAPVKSIKDFVAYAREQQGKLSIASPGVGSANHLAMELLAMRMQFKYLHVPYKGAGEAVVALAAGQTMASLPSVAGMLPFVESGKVRALAVTTLKRAASLPNTPTLDETIAPGFNYGVWYGVAVPAATPHAIVDRLNAALAKAMQMPDVREALDRQAMLPYTGTPPEFGALVAREIDQTAKLMQAAGLKAE
jgi:tripartite-type tricarboxylate transporter receptor subunit TctC